jgi:amino acid adenylation domain-containing protein
VEVETGTAKFEMTIYLREEANGGLAGLLEYQTELFEPDTITRFVGHYARLLERVAANPAQRISAAEVLDEEERRRLLVEWNDTRREYASGRKCLHELFEEQAQLIPNALAASCGDEHVTYAELNRRANQLANYLGRLGVRPESRVAVLMERSLEMVVGLLGVLKAGGCYVPLDPAYPAGRLAFMTQDASVELMLTQERLRGCAPPSGTVLAVYIDTEGAAVAREDEENLESGVLPDNLLYVIYTSGSTGQPKGVAMTHRAISNLIAWQLENSPLVGAAAKTLQFTPLSFDVSIQEIFSTWRAGGTLEIISEEERRDPTAVLRRISEREVRRIFLPFVALQQLAEASCTFGLVPEGLREVITAGEQLQITQQLSTLFEALPGCSLHNQYGPSESHVVSAYTLAGAPDSWPTLPPIGRAVANSQLYVLDARLQPVPTGVAGELYLGGVALARGYLARPDATAEKFIPHPFSDEPGARLYRTGDLSRWLPDGQVEFLGRADQQVKVRGFRVELGEIEALLSRHPAVEEAVVVACNGGPGGKHLVAYVIGKRGEDCGFNLLSCFLREHLPDYMVPSVFARLESFPLTPSGKVDRRRLPDPEGQRPSLESAYVEPETEAQRKIAAIWRGVLQIERVGINDNFFDLGGHSLLMVQLNSRLRAAFDCDISLVEMFKYSTVGSLAEYLSRKETAPTSFDASYQRAEMRKHLRRRQDTLRPLRPKDDESQRGVR